MFDANNADLGDAFTLPCVLSCAMAVSAAALAAKTSYTMGTASATRGGPEYRRAYWALCCAVLCASCAFVVIKMLE